MEDAMTEATAMNTTNTPYSEHCQAGLHQHCAAEECLCDCHLCDEDE